MLERALAAGVPAAWVRGDSVYGGDRGRPGATGGDRRRRVWLEQQEQPFVLAVASAEPLFAVLAGHWGEPRADVIAGHIPPDDWQRLLSGAGRQRAAVGRLGAAATGAAATGAAATEGGGAALGALVTAAPQPPRADRAGLLRRVCPSGNLTAHARAGGGATLAH
jgi:hypothetical protein